MLGLLRRLDGGPARTVAHGYISRGGTLDVAGMLFANRSTWAHLAESTARLLNRPRDQFLSPAACAAIDGNGEPHALTTPPSAKARQSVESGKRVSVRVDHGGRSNINNKKKQQ